MADRKYKITFELTDGTNKSVEFTVPHGDPGKSAYEYAKDAGYTGTEEEFAQKLATGGSTFDPTAYGLPVLYLTGNTAGMSKDKAVTLDYVYGEHSGTASVKWQGSSSIVYPKKNYTIKFDNAFEAAEGWGAQKKYCLKANYIDHSHARNIVSAKLWGEVVRSRDMSSGNTSIAFQDNNGTRIPNDTAYTYKNDVLTANFNVTDDGAFFLYDVDLPEAGYTITCDVFFPEGSTDLELTAYFKRLDSGLDGMPKATATTAGVWETVSFTELWAAGSSTIVSLSGTRTSGVKFRNIRFNGLYGAESLSYERQTQALPIQDLPNGGAIDGFPVCVYINGQYTGLYTFNIPKDGWMFGMGNNTQTTVTETFGFDSWIVFDSFNQLTGEYTPTVSITTQFVTQRSPAIGGRAYCTWDNQKIAEIAVRAHIFDTTDTPIKVFGLSSEYYGKSGDFGADALKEPGNIEYFWAIDSFSIPIPPNCYVIWEIWVPNSTGRPDGTLTNEWSEETQANGTWIYEWVKTGIEYSIVSASDAKECILCANNHSAATRFESAALCDESDFEIEYITDETDTAWAIASVNRLISAVMNSTGADIDSTIAKYLDIQSAIDFYIFTALQSGQDNVDKNYILATYDGVKWFFSTYDMDSTFGNDWTGKCYISTQSYPTLLNFGNKVIQLLRDYKTVDVKNRYNQLRSTVLSEDNVLLKFENFMAGIPSALYEQDTKLWPLIPGTKTNNISQIANFYRLRVQLLDAQIEQIKQLTAITNLVPTSTDPKTGEVYNGVGYKDGVVAIDPEYGYEENKEGFVATGLISFPAYSITDINVNPYISPVLYVKGNVSFDDPNTTIVSYQKDGSYCHQTNQSAFANFYNIEELSTGYYKITYKTETTPSGIDITTIHNWLGKYPEKVQLSMKGIGDGLIVTLNEPIE